MQKSMSCQSRISNKPIEKEMTYNRILERRVELKNHRIESHSNCLFVHQGYTIQKHEINSILISRKLCKLFPMRKSVLKNMANFQKYRYVRLNISAVFFEGKINVHYIIDLFIQDFPRRKYICEKYPGLRSIPIDKDSVHSFFVCEAKVKTDTKSIVRTVRKIA